MGKVNQLREDQLQDYIFQFCNKEISLLQLKARLGSLGMDAEEIEDTIDMIAEDGDEECE